MSNQLSALVLGLPEELAEEFEREFRQTKLRLDVDFFADLTDIVPTDESAVFHYNIILFVQHPDGKKKMADYVKELKAFSPLSELITIVFDRNYDTVFSALKLGIRDIIEYPFQASDVKYGLEKAITYGSLIKYSESYGPIMSLLNLFARPGGFRSIKDIFETTERYFRTNLGLEYFEVFLKTGDEEPEVIVEGQHRLSTEKRNSVMQLAEKTISLFEQKKIHFVHNEFEGSSFLTINFGSLNDNRLIGLLLIRENLDRVNEIFTDYFFKMIHNAIDYQINYDTKEQMMNLAHTDDVTGLYNQRKLYKDIHTQVQRYKMTEEPFCIVFIDLDNFKQINDGHGHIVGSDLLLQAAQVFLEGIRDHDLLYRYGGDEFVILITKANNEQAKSVCHRLLDAVKSRDFKGSDGQVIRLSASIGIAEFPVDAASPQDIISLADEMMYNSKKAGRGKVLNARDYFQTKKTA